MSAEMRYVRDRYGVPARRGGRVRFDGNDASIRSANNGYLSLRLDSGQVVLVHPTWLMEYINPWLPIPTSDGGGRG